MITLVGAAVLGAGALVSLDEDDPDPAWVRFGAIADTADAAVVLACRDAGIPR